MIAERQVADNSPLEVRVIDFVTTQGECVMRDWDASEGPRDWKVYVEFWALLVALLIGFGAMLVQAAPALAHSGGLAADGCHNDRQNGGRHCHRGPNAGAASQPQTLRGSGAVYYPNCTAARNAGAAPVRRGDPGYASHLDRDGDGVGCE